jgi:transposase-like protein
MASQEKNKYSLAFKQQVIQEYERGATFAALQRKYGIPQGPTIRRWLKQFNRPAGDQSPMTEPETSPTPEIQALQERIAALEKLVAQLSLDKLMLESTVAVLERRDEPVKKKSDTRSSARRSGGGPNNPRR